MTWTVTLDGEPLYVWGPDGLTDDDREEILALVDPLGEGVLDAAPPSEPEPITDDEGQWLRMAWAAAAMLWGYEGLGGDEPPPPADQPRTDVVY